MRFFQWIGDIVRSRKSVAQCLAHVPAEDTAPDEPIPVDPMDDAPELFPLRERLECFKSLTPREREVFSHLIRGRKLKEIASLLGVTYATVNFHCKGLYRKLRINTRAQLFLQYAALGNSGAANARGQKP